MPWGRLFICSGLRDSRPAAPSANSLTMGIPRGSREPRIQIGDWKLRSTLSAIAFLALCAASFGQQPANAPYLDLTLSPEKRAADLVSRMTLEEKVLQMQNSAPAIPRLGVPVYNWWNEALHGVAQHRATVFPEPIGLGASFDPELVHKMADVISTEARAKFHEATRRAPHRAASLTWITGRRTSTSSATRDGAAGRRPTAKIRFSPAAWASHSSRACRVTIRGTSKPSPLLSTMRCTAARSRCATPSMPR